MTTDRELMQQSLEALEDACGRRCNAENNPCWQREIADALRERLAQPEPARVITADQLSKMFHSIERIDPNQPGYHWRNGWNDALRQAMDYSAAPPRREWVGLTEEDFSAINQSCLTKLQAATSAESILKEKNA